MVHRAEVVGPGESVRQAQHLRAAAEVDCWYPRLIDEIEGKVQVSSLDGHCETVSSLAAERSAMRGEDMVYGCIPRPS